MRIELPTCGFKNCKYYFDGNCTNKIEYHKCEYGFLKYFAHTYEKQLLEFMDNIFKEDN